MLNMTGHEIEKLKDSVKDKVVLAYIDELEYQNARLHSHHSHCKTELGDLVESANKWRLRAHVAEQLAHYLNSIYLPGTTFMTPGDLTNEITIQTKRLTEKHRAGISFMADDLKQRGDFYTKEKKEAKETANV